MQVSEQKIVVLGTGGTIAGRASRSSDTLGYTAGQVPVDELLQGLPALEGRAIHSEQVAQLDSKDMSHAVWRALALRCAHWLAQPDVCGLVVTHGTDTIEETAFFLHSVLSPRKPVVLTCAMRPATALVPDGPQNLADALTLAGTNGAQGVLVVCGGVVHGAQDVQKVHHYRLDPFSSGDAGPVARIEAGNLFQVRNWPVALADSAHGAMKMIANETPWPRVGLVHSHAGVDAVMVDAAIRSGLQGVVVAGTGNGTVHADLEAVLLAAMGRGIRVVRTTRCAEGRVLPVATAAIADARSLTPAKARIALMLELMGHPWTS